MKVQRPGQSHLNNNPKNQYNVNLDFLQTGISFLKEIKNHTMKMEKNYNVNVELSKNSYDRNSAKPYDVNSGVNTYRKLTINLADVVSMAFQSQTYHLREILPDRHGGLGISLLH